MYIYLFISNNNSKRLILKDSTKRLRKNAYENTKSYSLKTTNAQAAIDKKHYASYSVLKLLQKRSEGYTTAISRNPTFQNTCP